MIYLFLSDIILFLYTALSPTNVNLLSSSEKYGGDFDFMIYRPFFKHSLDYSLLMDISYFRMIFQLKRQIS